MIDEYDTLVPLQPDVPLGPGGPSCPGRPWGTGSTQEVMSLQNTQVGGDAAA